MNILIEPLYIGFIQTFISILLVSGLLFFGRVINGYFFPDYNNTLCNLLLSVIFFSQLLKILSYLDYFKEANFIFTIGIFIFGIYNSKMYLNFLKNLNFNFKISFFEILILLIIFCFFIISISPPSMADALDYHYGIPIYLLNFNELPNPYLWIHGALLNNGEFLNSLAIYARTDNFGSFLQFLILINFIIYLKNKIKNKKKFIFIAIFILCSPTLLQLISGPKFLLFPQVATATALLLVIEKKKINTGDFLFICILLGGASQFKLSFLLSGFFIALFLLFKSLKNNKKINILIFTSILIFIFFFPTIFWNYYQLSDFNYHNLVSSIPLEAINSLQNYKENNFIYPFNLLIPSSLGSISTILGLQFLIIPFIYKNKKELNSVLIVIIFTIILHFFLSMNIGRIYYEFILWLAVGIYFLKNNLNYLIYTKIILIQFLVVFFLASYFAVISIPSLFSLESREQFMHKNSYHYSAIKWANQNLPNKSKIISGLRSVALYKNEFIPTDWLNYNISNIDLKEYLNLIEEKKIDYIILEEGYKKNHILEKCIGEKFLESPKFLKSTRNPMNRNQRYSISIYEFNNKNVINCVE
jgi:hypothetical protein